MRRLLSLIFVFALMEQAVAAPTMMSLIGQLALQATQNIIGLLKPLSPAAVANAGGPFGLAISPDDKSLYVANNSAGTLSMFSRDVTTGNLTALSTPTILTGSQPIGVVVSPDNLSVYVTNYNANTVSMYNRDVTTGLLTALTPATRATSTRPYGIAISPDGNFVYITSSNGGVVSQYSRDPVTGLLAALSPAMVATGGSGVAIGIAISADGNNVYVTNSATPTSTISQYTRDAVTGKLTIMTPARVNAGPDSYDIKVSPDGNNVYAVNQNAFGSPGSISQYSRNPVTGALTALTPARAQLSASEPQFLTVSNDNKSVYVVSRKTSTSLPNSAIHMFNRDQSTGKLSALTHETVPLSAQSYCIGISNDDGFVYATSYLNNQVFMFERSK